MHGSAGQSFITVVVLGDSVVLRLSAGVVGLVLTLAADVGTGVVPFVTAPIRQYGQQSDKYTLKLQK